MDFDWTTFVLEIVNFLILVWLLKHFFYGPLQAVISRRQAAVDQTLADAKQHHDEADALKAKYDQRLADWEQEKVQARDALDAELADTRRKRLAQLDTELQQVRDRDQALAEREQAAAGERARAAALREADAFLRKLLAALRGPELEARLLKLLTEELQQLPPAELATLRKAWQDPASETALHTAYPMAADARAAFLANVTEVLGRRKTEPVAEQDASLLAGVRLRIDGWVLGATLADELTEFLTEAGHAS